jgi:hypothetical protein
VYELVVPQRAGNWLNTGRYAQFQDPEKTLNKGNVKTTVAMVEGKHREFATISSRFQAVNAPHFNRNKFTINRIGHPALVLSIAPSPQTGGEFGFLTKFR